MSITNPDPGNDITTSGGAYVGGNVQAVGAFVGRDQNIYIAFPPSPQPFLWVNVPPKPAQPLVGREAMLDDLVTRLLSGHSSALSTDGLPGAGKTALAVALAHDARVQAHFTGGILWGGLGTSPDPGTVVNQWAVAAGVDLADLPDLPGRLQRLSAVLASRTLLVILDDAWDNDVPRLLRLGCPHAVHLLTTRSREIARAFAGAGQQVHVPELASDPALQLLRQLAPEASAADPVAAAHLVDAVGGLPLALELLGGYLAVPERSLFPDLSAQAFAELADPQRRLALAQARLGDVTGRVQTLEEMIQLSLADLGRSNPAASAAFYALGAFAPKPAHFDRSAAAVVASADSAALALLVKLNLVEIDDAGRLALHQVIAAAACTHMPQDAADRHDAYFRSQIDHDRDNWQRIQYMYGQVGHALRRLSQGDERIVPWVGALRVYWNERGLAQEQLQWSQQALYVANRNDDSELRATLLNNIGMIYSDLGDQQRALACYEGALMLRQQMYDKAGEATVLTGIGGIHYVLGNKQLALTYLERALPLRRQVGDKAGEAATLNNIAMICSDKGNQKQALAYSEEALMLRRQVGDSTGEATTLDNMGCIYLTLGNKRQAIEYFDKALSLARQNGSRRTEATTLNNIGIAYSALGDNQKARAYFDEALGILRQVGDKRTEATTLNNIGKIFSDLGDEQQARVYYEHSLWLSRQLGDISNEASTITNIGTICASQGAWQNALTHYERALRLTREGGNKVKEAIILTNIGDTFSHLGDKQQAREYYEQVLLLQRQIDDKAGEATTLTKIGAVYLALGNKRQARTYYEQALSLLRQGDNKSGEAITLTNIAWLFFALGDKHQALACCDQARSLFRQLGDEQGEAVVNKVVSVANGAKGSRRAK